MARRPVIQRIKMPDGTVISRVRDDVIDKALKAAGRKLAAIRKASRA